MWAALALLASQPTDASAWKADIESAVTQSQIVVDQTFDCLDKKNKAYLKAHWSSATPELVINSAFESCEYLKQAYAEAVAKPPSPISIIEAQKLADDFYKSLRSPLIKSMEYRFISPDFADFRAKLAVMQWRDCTTTKAKEWFRLKDDARTISQAAVTACHQERKNALLVFGYQLRSKSLPSGNSEKMTDSLAIKMNDLAIEIIISERAKRLPKMR